MKYGFLILLAVFACACQPANDMKALHFGPTPEDEFDVGDMGHCNHCGQHHN